MVYPFLPLPRPFVKIVRGAGIFRRIVFVRFVFFCAFGPVLGRPKELTGSATWLTTFGDRFDWYLTVINGKMARF